MYISIHALAKRATEGDDWKHPYDIISIHALAKRATIKPVQKSRPSIFQSTPSQRGRLASKVTLPELDIFQSTPSQRGRPLLHVYRNKPSGISIHALAKRATHTLYSPAKHAPISIHALAKRATPFSVAKIGKDFDFNPRPRKEGDHFDSWTSARRN